MPTNDVPISRAKSAPPLPSEAVEIYAKMSLRPAADEVWWRLHDRLVDLLKSPPYAWPLLPAPGEATKSKFQWRLQRKLDAALAETDAA